MGGISLDTYDEIGRRRVFFGRGIQAIPPVCWEGGPGVSRWEDLPGTFVRVEESAWGTMVFRFGNILEDKWFDIPGVYHSPGSCSPASQGFPFGPHGAVSSPVRFSL